MTTAAYQYESIIDKYFLIDKFVNNIGHLRT